MSVIDQDSMSAESKDANLNELNFETQGRKSAKRNIQRSVDMKFQNVTGGNSLLFEDNSPLLHGNQNEYGSS